MAFSLCLMMFAGVGLAQTPERPTAVQVDQGRQLYQMGAKLYESGRYDEALAAFREAYELTGRSGILFNMANAQERLGDLEGAIGSLNRYLPQAPGTKVDAIKSRIAALQERLDAPVLPLPAPGAVDPAVVSEAPAVTPPVQTKVKPRWELVAIGGTVAAGFGAVAAFSYLDGLENRDQLDEQAYQRNVVVNNVALSIAGVGGGLAIVGFAVPRKYQVLVSAAPSGATVSLRW